MCIRQIVIHDNVAIVTQISTCKSSFWETVETFFMTFRILSLVFPLAAMSLVDSSAAFERKCRDLKGGDALFEGLSALGISDFSTLAGYTTETSDG